MRRCLLLVLIVGLAACNVPRDPEGTLARVSGGVIRAGYTVAPPWASGAPDSPSGVEIDIVEALADELNASVEWTEGSQAELFAALEEHALDIVVGGFDAKDPLVLTGGATRPYATTRLTVGVAEGEPVPQELKGATIAAEAGTEAEGLVKAAGASVQPVSDVTASDAPLAAVDSWLLDDLGRVDSGHHLQQHEHVMAVPPGENGWLVALERYLFAHATDISTAIAESGPA